MDNNDKKGVQDNSDMEKTVHIMPDNKHVAQADPDNEQTVHITSANNEKAAQQDKKTPPKDALMPPQGQGQTMSPQGQPGMPPQGQPMPPQGQGAPMPPQGQPGMPPQGQGAPMSPQGQPGMPPQGQPMPPQGKPGMPQQGQPMPPQGKPGMPPQGQPGMPPQGQPMPPQGMGMPQQGQPMPPQGMGMPPQGKPGMPQQGQPMPPQGMGMPQQGQPMPPQGMGMPPQGMGMPPQGNFMPQDMGMPPQGHPMQQKPPRPPKPPKEKKPMTKKQKTTIIAVASVIAVIAIATCVLFIRAKKDEPDEEYYKSIVPSELITYTLDGEEITAEVESIKINTQDSEMFEDEAECEITLVDDKLRRTVTCEFESERNLISKWKCENATYDVDEIEVEFKSDYAKGIAEKLGYEGTDYEKDEYLSRGEVGFYYYVENKYPLCTVSGRIRFSGWCKGELVDGKFIYTSDVTANANGLNCEWTLEAGTYRQSGTDEAEVVVKVEQYGSEIDYTFTTSQFGEQVCYDYVNTQYDADGKPYMELTYYSSSLNGEGDYVSLAYYLKIDADKIDTAKVSSDDAVYYSCGLEKGEYDVVVTQTKEYYGQSFAINNKPIEIVAPNADSVMLVYAFKELYPEYADLIVCKDFTDISINEIGEETLNILNADERPSIILYDIDNMWDHGIIKNEHIVPLSSVGITEDMYADSYKYAIGKGTYNNDLRALTWELCPGYFFYKKDIAKEVLETDDPKEIQAMLSDWNGFNQVSAKVRKAGYAMIPSAYSVLYPTLGSRKNAWVAGNDFTADTTIDNYFARVKNMEDKGNTENCDMWSDKYRAMENSFGNFGASLFTNMYDIFDGSTNYGMCMGPAAYNWGGQTALVTDNCENEGLLQLFLYVTCCNSEGIRSIINTNAFYDVNGDTNFVPNNKQVVAYYKDHNYTIGKNYFDNQNLYEYFDEILNNITEGDYCTEYDILIKSAALDYSQKYVAGEYENEKAAINAMEEYLKESYGLE